MSAISSGEFNSFPGRRDGPNHADRLDRASRVLSARIPRKKPQAKKKTICTQQWDSYLSIYLSIYLYLSIFTYISLGKVRKTKAHTGGLSRLRLRPAGPCGWAGAPPAPCGPLPGIWPRLDVGLRRAGSLPRAYGSFIITIISQIIIKRSYCILPICY